MEGPRAPTNTEYTDIVKFLDTNLRQNSTWSVADEYPTVFTEHNLHNFRIIKTPDEILSHAVIKPLLTKTRRAVFKVGCIGSVITNEKHRNSGLSQNVIQECLNEIKKQDCDFAILWSNLYDFYRKLGFELAGSEVSLLIDKPLNVKNNFKILDSNKVDPQALYRIYSQHSVGAVRNLDDFTKYLTIPNSRLYTAWTS
ncbi:MAG: GNAT family N-acetyltransferase [Oligoflexia bacterium]|nr:GNAT family N-acetyltransferase [Oligoflexia bacterium]